MCKTTTGQSKTTAHPVPSGAQVADKAKAYSVNGIYWGPGYCEKFCRTCAGAAALAASAADAYYAAKYRHTGTPPRGAFVFWTGGSHGYGHVAISDGNGWCWSTDIKRPGRVDRVAISTITTRWGLTLKGWTEDNNGVRVTGLVAAKVTVRLRNLKPGLGGAGSPAFQDVTDLQLALRRHGMATFTATGYFGDLTRAAVQKFQKAQGWSGSDANGIPGPHTCALLGLTVIS